MPGSANSLARSSIHSSCLIKHKRLKIRYLERDPQAEVAKAFSSLDYGI